MPLVKGTHRENKPSNKTETLTKSMNMYIWVIGNLNQLFIKGYYTQIKSSKKIKKSAAKVRFSICLNIGFWQGSFVRKCCAFIRITLN